MYGLLRSWRRFPRQNVLSAISEDQSQCSEQGELEQVNQHPTDEDISLENNSFLHYEGTGGRPGFISFYNHSKEGNRIPLSSVQSNQYKFLWFVGPAVLVASFIFPLFICGNYFQIFLRTLCWQVSAVSYFCSLLTSLMFLYIVIYWVIFPVCQHALYQQGKWRPKETF